MAGETMSDDMIHAIIALGRAEYACRMHHNKYHYSGEVDPRNPYRSDMYTDEECKRDWAECFEELDRCIMAAREIAYRMVSAS
jgi:hypothetical protein